MIHKVIAVGALQSNCSILGDETTKEAMVVDPGADADSLFHYLGKLGLTVKQIVLTHAHLDHVGGAARLKQLTGAPIYMNPKDQPLLDSLDAQAAWMGMTSPERVVVDHNLNEGDTIQTGSISATVMHTPGHTEGSVCLYLPGQKKLIAGDTLFMGSVGRTDLPGGSYEKLVRSLHDRILPLPDETEVTTGHGPSTSIGMERGTNPFLR